MTMPQSHRSNRSKRLLSLTQGLFFFLFLVSIGSAHAQDLANMVRSHQTLGNGAVLVECDKDGAITGATIKVPGKAKAWIVNFVNNGGVVHYIIQFDNWEGPNASEEATLDAQRAGRGVVRILTGIEQAIVDKPEYESYFKFNYDPATGATRYFRVTKDELSLWMRPLLPTWSPLYGAAVLPFKLRRGSDFTKDISISGLGGIRLNTHSRKLSFAVVTGIGLASVTLDSLNTDGNVTRSADLSALSIPLGIVIEWDRLQFGFFTGWDNLSRKDRQGWIYQGDRWFAFGVGFALFNEQKNEGKSNAGSNSGSN